MQIAFPSHLAKIWDILRSSFWFVPTLLTVTAVLLSIGLNLADQYMQSDQRLQTAWFYIGEPQSARAILATIAGAVITIVSLTFSITIVALTLAISQFGSRLLYNFMRDRGNQLVLGTFVGTFVYCLLVLRQVTIAGDEVFVPHLSVSTAIILAIIGIAVLIYFIHHVAESIQANTVISNVSMELHRTIKQFLPEKRKRQIVIFEDPEKDIDFEIHTYTVKSPVSAFIQAIEIKKLKELAIDHDWTVKILVRPGDFVIDEIPLLMIANCDTLDKSTLTTIHKCFIMGRRRNLIQDIEFAFQQLVELAIRALSPGINDPFSAISCIDELASGLALTMRRHLPSPYLYDQDQNLRVIMSITDFDSLVGSAFNQIRQHGSRDMAVMIHLLEAIESIMPFAKSSHELQVLTKHAELVHDIAHKHAETDFDKLAVSQRYERLQNSLAIALE